MAEYFTLFSVVLPLGTPENVTTARALYQSFGEELERIEGETIGFSIGKAPGNEPAAIWMHDDANGNPEHVIAFVRRCAETFKLEGRWGFCWALTCSQPRCDGFGGGAHVLDLATGETVGWVDCETWLTSQLDLAYPPSQYGGAALQTSTISLEGAAAAEQVADALKQPHRT